MKTSYVVEMQHFLGYQIKMNWTELNWFMSFPFGIGTMLVHFHILGNVRLLIQMLNNFVTDGAIEQAVAFSMRAEVLSGPLALAISSELESSTNSSTSHRRSTGHWSGSTWNLLRSSLLNCGCSWWNRRRESHERVIHRLICWFTFAWASLSQFVYGRIQRGSDHEQYTLM